MKEKIKQLKDKSSIEGDLNKPDKIKLSRLEFEYKHALADVVSLDEELASLKELQAQKRAEKKKKKDEIFSNVDEDLPDANAYLANLCGLPTNAEQTKEDAAGNVVTFENM